MKKTVFLLSLPSFPKLFISVTTALCIGLGALYPTQALSTEPAAMPKEVTHVLAHLVDAVQTRHDVRLEELTPLIDFADNAALSREDWAVDNLLDATGAYFGYSLSSPVERIISYLYHPGLPPSLFHPSVVRTGLWQREPQENIPMLWENLQEHDILALYGRELEENTPDLNTGGYYHYETDRLLLLLKHNKKKYLISVSKQVEQSSVGHKGVVVGDDADWNYYYTGEEGLTKAGLGWVNSYIFDSFSVTVLSADHADPQRSRHVMFKWVRAGWSGINMVRPGHVRDGCRRFAQSLTTLMESPKLPSVQAIAAMTDHVLAMSRTELEKTLKPYVQAMRELGEKDSTLSRRAFRSLLEQDFLKHYTLEAKQSLVMKEYLKDSIGMPALLSVSDVLPATFARYADQ